MLVDASALTAVKHLLNEICSAAYFVSTRWCLCLYKNEILLTMTHTLGFLYCFFCFLFILFHSPKAICLNKVAVYNKLQESSLKIHHMVVEVTCASDRRPMKDELFFLYVGRVGFFNEEEAELNNKVSTNESDSGQERIEMPICA